MNSSLIKIPIDREFDVTPDSLYPQTPEELYVEYFEMNAGDLADDFYDYLMNEVKEGDVRWVDSKEFDNFCKEYGIDKQFYVIELGGSQKLFDVILMNGANAVFKHMPEFKDYIIDEYEWEIIYQENDRRKQAEYELEREYQKESTKAFKIVRKILPSIVKVEPIKEDDDLTFIKPVPQKVKLYLQNSITLTNEEKNLLKDFGIEV